jgi:hypothetical protein
LEKSWLLVVDQRCHRPIFEQTAQERGGLAVSLLENMGVRPQGHTRVRVTEAPRRGADVDTTGQHHCGGKVTKMVESSLGQAGTITYFLKGVSYTVRPPGRSMVDIL